MGGIGSGRPQQNRLTTEWFQLDVRWLNQHCDLRTGLKSYVRLPRDGGHAMVRVWTKQQKLCLHFDFGPDLFGPRTLECVLGLSWVSCPYGGHLPLLGCENASCDRWVQILYGREDFLCRRCRRVTYPIQRIAPELRPLARAQLLRVRLGGSPDINQPFPSRPKGMHSWTYTQKIAKIFAAERAAAGRLLDAFGERKKSSDGDSGSLFSGEKEIAGDLEIPVSEPAPSEQVSVSSMSSPEGGTHV